MKTIPFYLAELGYEPDKANSRRFVPKCHVGHPFYPVEFDNDLQKTSGDCIRAIALAAFNAGRGVNTTPTLVNNEHLSH